jgi:hypothetical protein
MDFIPNERQLTEAEEALVRWLLNHSLPSAREYLPQLERARVVARCGCGCASIDFAIDDVVPARGDPIGILADFEWQGPQGEMFGVFVFERGGLLAGLEVWSQDGLAKADSLPNPELLRPSGTGDRATGNEPENWSKTAP